MENKYNLVHKIEVAVPKDRILTDEPMAEHTTFKVGGPADIFIDIVSEDELGKVLSILNENNISKMNRDFYLFGNGSNLLISDEGLRGIVLHLSKNFADIDIKDEATDCRLICKAGATLAAIARKAYDNSLTGFEFAAGIPGTLGGAIVMNAGAYDGEMKQVVESVKLMDTHGRIFVKSCDEMDFSYRHSIIKENDFIVLEVVIRLKKGNKDDIKAKMDELAKKRRDKQPLEYPSAGSTFKRPEGYFAAKLIQDAGLKGYSKGGAQVSEKHCGFVINKDNASAKDIYELIKDIKLKVKQDSGVDIETEVILLGKFD